MSFLRLFFVCGAIIFCLSSCNVDTAQPASVGEANRADTASFKALIGPKWCLSSAPETRNFMISWNFREDGVAYYTKTNQNGQIILNQKTKWFMRSKTLTVLHDTSGVELLKKNIGFALDLSTGNQVMTWTNVPKNTDCTPPGPCSGQTSSSTTLTECE